MLVPCVFCRAGDTLRAVLARTAVVLALALAVAWQAVSDSSSSSSGLLPSKTSRLQIPFAYNSLSTRKRPALSAVL